MTKIFASVCVILVSLQIATTDLEIFSQSTELFWFLCQFALLTFLVLELVVVYVNLQQKPYYKIHNLQYVRAPLTQYFAVSVKLEEIFSGWDIIKSF